MIVAQVAPRENSSLVGATTRRRRGAQSSGFRFHFNSLIFENVRAWRDVVSSKEPRRTFQKQSAHFHLDIGKKRGCEGGKREKVSLASIVNPRWKISTSINKHPRATSRIFFNTCVYACVRIDIVGGTRAERNGEQLITASSEFRVNDCDSRTLRVRFLQPVFQLISSLSMPYQRSS